ncbi:hypothetical protein NA57DRAFT_38404 [Rhizodiscina lignyota]|uniref:3-beta hydroxysteroid dehydrogenase/isomerase domain-containing protein n=1 Tax=Rhizodiscina lignyota TaxID=1504668 RepID=A0A9P4IKK7_9PEZI|nr:hypothetical protein NA57DRAFT_38404 [Rhizodiscina lignyota]
MLQPLPDDLPKPLQPIKSALVVGGCGFLGHHIVHQLLQRHHDAQIHVLDLRCEKNIISDARLSYHDGDITDPAAMAALLNDIKPQAVIHTASPHFGVTKAMEELMYKVNVSGTKNLLEKSKECGSVKAFVYTSSASVVMKKVMVMREGGLRNVDEDWAVAAENEQWEYYGTTKALAEQAVLEANRTATQFFTAAIRPALIYGEGDIQALPLILQAARRGQWRFQIGDNSNLFDVTYAGNAAYAHLLAAEALLYTHTLGSTVPLDLERVDGEAFFVTNDAPVYFWDFCRQAWKAAGIAESTDKVWVLGQSFSMGLGAFLEGVMWVLGKQANLTKEKVRFSTISRYYNISKAKKRLGYRSIVGFEEGIRRAVVEIDERGAGGKVTANAVNGHANGTGKKAQ